MVKIVQKENPALHQPAKPVAKALLGSDELKKIIKEMSEALAKENDGVALAAPQIALPLQIFIISGKIFTAENDLVEGRVKPDLVFINPTITNLSKAKQEMEEGCLSVRWLYGEVKRSTKATVTAYDLNGKKFTRSGSGLLAQIFQHEMDHLNGVLFTDKTKAVKEYQPEPKK